MSGTGRIAARLDRLPLTWVQWRLALITQVFWGVIIAADGIPAKLYPFIWGPRHSFGVGAFSVLLAVQFGVGILVGEYLIGIASDRWGRRKALLLSSLVVSLPLWPTALTDQFGLLLVFFGLSAIGMGGVLSTNVVYMGEIVPPRERGRVMLASQVLAVLVFGLLGNVPGILWVPDHYQWFIYLFTLVPLVVLVPLALWAMPESPRWLEAHGHHGEADRVSAPANSHPHSDDLHDVVQLLRPYLRRKHFLQMSRCDRRRTVRDIANQHSNVAAQWNNTLAFRTYH